jgi:hypothetical protein
MKAALQAYGQKIFRLADQVPPQGRRLGKELDNED